jgi:hypothetical protein
MLRVGSASEGDEEKATGSPKSYHASRLYRFSQVSCLEKHSQTVGHKDFF